MAERSGLKMYKILNSSLRIKCFGSEILVASVNAILLTLSGLAGIAHVSTAQEAF